MFFLLQILHYHFILPSGLMTYVGRSTHSGLAIHFFPQAACLNDLVFPVARNGKGLTVLNDELREFLDRVKSVMILVNS
jgi:hypothetical protein